MRQTLQLCLFLLLAPAVGCSAAAAGGQSGMGKLQQGQLCLPAALSTRVGTPQVSCGNLVGITTFTIGEGENLNFAIAAEEFCRM